MGSTAHMSPAKLATYNRQKAINLLEKITKNMFRMFRDDKTTQKQISERFHHLHKQLESLGDIVLNAEYHREMRIYIENLSHTFKHDFDLDAIRSKNMSTLNRIQKIKNQAGYKRKKKGDRDRGDRRKDRDE